MQARTIPVTTTALVLCTALAAFAQAKPDFWGTWTLEQAAGGGPPRQLTLAQDADTLTVSFIQGGTTTTFTYNLDGSESRNQEPGEPPSVSRVRWENGRLVIATPSTVGGKDVEQRNVLSMDGDNLVLETDRINLGGESTVVRLVYTKSG